MRRLLATLAVATTLLVLGASDASALVDTRIIDKTTDATPTTAEQVDDEVAAATTADDAVDSGRWVRAGLIGLVLGVVIGVVVARRNRARRFGASRVP